MKRTACLLLCLLLFAPAATAEFVFATPEPQEAPPAQDGVTFIDITPAPAEGGVTFTDVTPAPVTTDAPEATEEGWPRKIVITVGGDTTLGCTEGQSRRAEGFDRVIKDKGYDWPFSELVKVFAEDDMTLLNFEGTLTESTSKQEGKQFNFKGSPEYAQMLVLGSVEAVNLANNHYGDYKDEGRADTRAALDAHGITYCAKGLTAIYETRGVKIGLIGNTFAYSNGKCDITADVKALREAGCQIVVASFHWGIEYEDYNRDQRNIGRAAINSGADIVVGHHPHIIQPIEAYEGTYILYSLGNLVFGGNTSPTDRDTFIAQLTFTVYEDGTVEGPELKLIPMRLTANSKGNTDYRPVFAEGETYDRILKKILGPSINMQGFVNPD